MTRRIWHHRVSQMIAAALLSGAIATTAAAPLAFSAAVEGQPVRSSTPTVATPHTPKTFDDINGAI